MGFDIKKIRADFPILKRTVRGKPLVYLDSAATSQRPRQVIDALSSFYENHNANIHRGVHALAEEAEALVEESRAKTARFIGAPKPETIVFTSNTTHSINLVAQGWGRKNLKPGDEVLITELEHHSNLVPWQRITEETGALLRYVPIEEDGTLTVEAARKAFSPKTKMFAFTAMSNSLGTVLPVKELIDLAHANGALTLVDAAQWVPHLKTDVAAWGVDFLAFSPHKMLGPTGLGVLYGKFDLLDAMDPIMSGGGMIQEVHYDRSTYAPPPHRFEAGTPNIADTAAFGAAIDYLEAVGMDAIHAHEMELTQRALEILEPDEFVTVLGPQKIEDRGGVVSFNIDDLHPHDVGQVFDSEGVAVRVGHHCCQPLMRKLGIGGTARASFYLYNSLEDVEAFARGLSKVKEFFKVGVPVKVS
ncbi:MAG: cysteine desulfurase [Elusimicrobia bacterium]|nr:MAG: cysteine desulfurase [Elusimicrobiota bacterium]